MPITTDKSVHVGLDPVTVDWSRFDKNPKKNPKDIPIGSVAYYLFKKDNRYHVDFGIVYDHYSDCVLLQRVSPRDRRMVVSEFYQTPVPFKDFPYNTAWRKLPKGWTWDTKLFDIVQSKPTEEEELFVLDITNPRTIIRAYQKGFLVNVRDVPFETIQSVIEKQNGYKLTRKCKEERRAPRDTVSVDFWQCFKTYEEAKLACDNAERELYEQASMSDLAWSIHLIDKDLDRWASIYAVSEENKGRVRAFLMQLQNLENIETRVESCGIQWRTFGKTRWNSVPIE